MYNDKKGIFTKNANAVLAISFRTKYRFKTHIFTYCRRNRNILLYIDIQHYNILRRGSIFELINIHIYGFY